MNTYLCMDITDHTMNKKSETINNIIDVVVRCCVTSVSDEGPSFTKDDVLGTNRSSPLVMTRCLVASTLISEGFSVVTIATVLHKTPNGIRNLLHLAIDYHRTSRAYRIAEDEVNDILSS